MESSHSELLVSKSSRFERLLVLLMLISLLLLPWPFGLTPDVAKSALVVWFLVIGLLWSLHLLRSGSPLFVGKQLTRVAWVAISLLIAVQLWVALQLQWTLSSYHTSMSLQLGLVYTLIFTMVLSLFYTRKRLILLTAVLIVGGTFQAFYGAAMVLSHYEMIWWHEKLASVGSASGTFVNRNHFAGYLEMTIAVAIGLMLALRTGEPWSWRGILELLLSPKLLIRLALVVMVIGLVMSQSRMGNSAFMLSLLFIGLIFVILTPQNRPRNLIILASLVVIDVLVISQFFGLERLKDRIAQTEVSVSTDSGSLVIDINDLRGLAVKQSLPLALESSLTGQGAGTFEIAFMSWAGLDFGGHFDHAHQDYLQFWIEYGAVGFLLLLTFTLLVLWHAFKAMRMRQSKFRSGLGFGVLMALIAIGVHAFSDFNLQIPANAITFIVICALAILTVYHRRVHRKVMLEEND